MVSLGQIYVSSEIYEKLEKMAFKDKLSISDEVQKILSEVTGQPAIYFKHSNTTKQIKK